MGEETSPLVHWLQITGRYEVVIQAGYVARSIWERLLSNPRAVSSK